MASNDGKARTKINGKPVTVEISYGNDADYAELSERQRDANPWTVEVLHQRKRRSFNYWTGPALGEPEPWSTLAQIIDSGALAGSGNPMRVMRNYRDEMGDYPDPDQAEIMADEYRRLDELGLTTLGAYEWANEHRD